MGVGGRKYGFSDSIDYYCGFHLGHNFITIILILFDFVKNISYNKGSAEYGERRCGKRRNVKVSLLFPPAVN